MGQQAADDAIANGQALDGGGDCPANVEEAEGDPADAASIEISIPDVVSGDSATLDDHADQLHARAPDGSTVDPHFGHYHIYLDKVPVDALTGSAHSHDDDGHERIDRRNRFDWRHGHGAFVRLHG